MARIRIIVAVLVAAAVIAAGVGPVGAQGNSPVQSKSGLAISPPTFELSANPGDVLRNSLRIDNISEQALEVTVEKRNFTALGEEGGINLSAGEGRYALAKWIAVTPAKFTIAAGETKTFDFSITVPPNAEPGGRFGSILFRTTAKPVQGQSGVAIAQEVGALVFVKIAGEVKEKADITSFKATRKINEYGPVKFDARVKNQGNVQFKPTGTITITNAYGKKVATVPLNSQNVLPDAVRKMDAEWKKRLIFGKYNATLSLVYGSDRQILTASTTFWAIPYTIIGIVLLGLVIIAAFLFPRRKRLGKAVKVLFGRE